jgi:hypothetical protein
MDNIDCYAMNGQTADQMIALVKEAMKTHTLLVFLFHGVGGGHNINVGLREHSLLLHYLKDHEKDIWIAPMVDVAEYIRNGSRPPSTQISAQANDTSPSENIDYSKLISGRFILSASHCAGFNFINKTHALWTNEIACNYPDTLKIRWLDNATFMTRSTTRNGEKCPPVVDIYKVTFFDGKRLTLKSIWTGWNDAKDELLEFHRQSK